MPEPDRCSTCNQLRESARERVIGGNSAFKSWLDGETTFEGLPFQQLKAFEVIFRSLLAPSRTMMTSHAPQTSLLQQPVVAETI